MAGMARYTIDRFYGIDQSADDSLIPAGYSPAAQNMDTTGGDLSVFPALKPYTRVVGEQLTGIEAARGMFSYHPYEPVFETKRRRAQLAVSTTNGVFLQPLTPAVWQRINSRAATDAINYQLGNRNLLVMADEGVTIYDGTSSEVVAGAPKVQFLTLNRERVFGSGSTAQGEMDTLYWSYPLNPANWAANPLNPDGAGGFVNIPSFDGGAIIGVQSIFGEVVIFKEHSMYKLCGAIPSEFSVERIPGLVNPVCDRAVVETGSGAYFLTREGLAVYDGVRARLIEHNDAIKKVWEEYPPDAGSDLVMFRQKLYMTLGSKDGILVEYDLRRRVFMVLKLFEGRNPCGLTVFDDKLIGYDFDELQLREIGGEADGLDIPKAFWESPWLEFSRKDTVKAVELMYLYGYSGGENELVVDVWTEKKHKQRVVKLSKIASVKRRRIKISGRRIKFRISNYRDEAGKPAIPPCTFTLLSGLSLAMELEED